MRCQGLVDSPTDLGINGLRTRSDSPVEVPADLLGVTS